MRVQPLLWIVSLAIAVGTWATVAHARTEQVVGWQKQDVLHGTLRHLRVDLGYEVVEKDAEAGYVLFRFVPHGHKEATVGSVEVVGAGEGKRSKLIVSLPKLPSYHELVLRDGLLKKLVTDYGEPAPEPERKPKEKDRDKDKGTDKGKGDEPRDRDKAEEPKDRSDSERRERARNRRGGSDERN